MDLTREDFLQSDWEAIISQSKDRECNYYWSHLRRKANEANESGDAKTATLFQLLSDICTLHLRLDSPEQPFGPMMTSHNARTAIAEDFSTEQLEFLRTILLDVTDADLRARIADLLWLLRRDHKTAKIAVDSYLESARLLEDPQEWVATNDRITRALQLARLMGRNAEPYTSVISHIEGVLDRCNGEDPLFLSARMMSLLQECRAGEAAKYIPIAEQMAIRAENERDWDRARTYWDINAKWHSAAGEGEKAAAVRLREAETYVRQSEMHAKGDPPSYMLASTFMQKAVEAMRRARASADRIRDLHNTLLEYQEKSVSEMRGFSSSIDITEMVSQAVSHVKGKSVLDALLNLSAIVKPSMRSQLRSRAEEDRKKYLFKTFFPNVYLNALGRVIARQPADDDEAILADMCSLANQHQSIRVQAIIEPARRQVIAEHSISVKDFVIMLSNHRLIPAGRETLVARGLYAGLHGDFVVSTHLLVPQVEESIRYILTQAGVIASSLDDKGIQEEIDLNRTLRAAKYTETLANCLGEDVVFELRALLVERFGANLRNDMAHGLLNHESFYAPASCYFWWLALHLYSYPVLARLKVQQTTPANADSNSTTNDAS